jgi:hypothetical protein
MKSCVIKNKLFIREWVVACFFLGVITTLFMTSTSSDSSYKNFNTKKQPQIISVIVIGCVRFPGMYKVPAGTTVKEVLEKAEWLPNSDKNTTYRKKVLLNSVTIEVFEKKNKKNRAKKQAFR